METAITILANSLRSTAELTLLVLLPVMVLMTAVMKVLEEKGLLKFLARILSPAMRLFGISGLAVVAILQQLFVSFAAPPTTLVLMTRNHVSNREITATLAMVLTMSQANVTFPLAAQGLNLWYCWLSSLVGGLIASSMTYYVILRRTSEVCRSDDPGTIFDARCDYRFSESLLTGGLEGGRLVLKSMKVIFVALLAVNLAGAIGAFALLESIVAPILEMAGLPGVAVLPVATKYCAGGTAMMGVTIKLLREDALNPLVLNRIAGFTINPLDIVGLSVLIPAVDSAKTIVWPAILGALCGILCRGVFHLLVF